MHCVACVAKQALEMKSHGLENWVLKTTVPPSVF